VQAGARRSTGFSAIDVPADSSFNADRDGYRNADVSAHLALPWAAGQELTLQLFRNRLDAQFDAGPGFDDRTITTVETWQVASRNRLAPWWSAQFAAGEGTDDSVSKTGFGDFPFKTAQRQYLWENAFNLPGGVLTAGYERREEKVTTDAGFAVTQRDTDAWFGIYQLSEGAHSLQANVRHDDSSQYGGRTTGAFAYGYRIAPGWRGTAAVSTGFKAPSFNDLYYPGFSNPGLSPESSRNAEVGAYAYGTSADGTWEARAIAYRNRVHGLIVFQCDAASNCAPQNVASARLEGVTLGLDTRLGTTSIAATIDLQRPEDEATGRLLPRRARRHGALALGQAIGSLRLGAEILASSARYDDAANTRRLGGYTTVNLTADWNVGQGVSAFVRADNVVDRDYRLAADYSTGGTTVFAGVRWRR
jgi:vitamin B12 transporter